MTSASWLTGLSPPGGCGDEVLAARRVGRAETRLGAVEGGSRRTLLAVSRVLFQANEVVPFLR